MKLQRVGDYLLGEKLGEGSFAKVRVGLHVISREKVSFYEKFFNVNLDRNFGPKIFAWKNRNWAKIFKFRSKIVNF